MVLFCLCFLICLDLLQCLLGGGGPTFLSPFFPTSSEDSDWLVTGNITGTIEERLVNRESGVLEREGKLCGGEVRKRRGDSRRNRASVRRVMAVRGRVLVLGRAMGQE